MKKQLLLILAALLPMVANADESGTCGDNLTWTYYESTHSLVFTGNGDMYDYSRGNIPWYKYSGDILSVTLPEGLTSIGKYAFYKCSGLTAVNIPKYVTTIGNYAFSECTGLTAVYISDLEAWCKIFFNGYTSNPLYYARRLYLNGVEIKDLAIPNSVTSIGKYAFYCCTGLTSVTIPKSVKTIGVSAFEFCSGLTAVSITDLAAWCIISFGNNNSNPLYCAHHLILNGEEVKDLVIPNSVTTIGNSTFCYCSSLTSVTIPNSVISIGGYAFSNCSSLTSVTIPNSVTSIGDKSFYACRGLTSVTIPNSVTTIGEDAFYSCVYLTSINISDLEAWCKISFANSTSNPLNYSGHLLMDGEEIKDLIIPNSVTSICNLAFYGCSGISSVTIGNNVISIGDDAFYSCSGISSVTIGNSVTSIGNNAFYGCSGITSVTIGNSVTSIGNNAFYGCSKMPSVTIPKSVATIGDSAFSECTGLTAVYISDLEAWCKIFFNGSTSNPLYYARRLFLNGVFVKDLVIPSSITSIGSFSFINCYWTSVNIPNSVTSIGNSAFRFGSFSSVILGSGIKTIREAAFEYSRFENMYCYAEKVPSKYTSSFYDSTIEYATLHVPAAYINEYQKHWNSFKDIVAIEDDDPKPTGIQNVQWDENHLNDKIFNLSGQSVVQSKKGIYITKGKKILIK